MIYEHVCNHDGRQHTTRFTDLRLAAAYHSAYGGQLGQRLDVTAGAAREAVAGGQGRDSLDVERNPIVRAAAEVLAMGLKVLGMAMRGVR